MASACRLTQARVSDSCAGCCFIREDACDGTLKATATWQTRSCPCVVACVTTVTMTTEWIGQTPQLNVLQLG